MLRHARSRTVRGLRWLARRLDAPNAGGRLDALALVEAELSSAVDLRQAAEAIAKRCLDERGVDWLQFTVPPNEQPRLAIAREDRLAAAQALATLGAGDGWVLQISGDGGVGKQNFAPQDFEPDAEATTWTLFRALSDDFGQFATDSLFGVRIDLWDRAPKAVTSQPRGLEYVREYVNSTHSKFMIPGESWEGLSGSGPDGSPHLEDIDFPIDVVYTWVDGTDPAWLERRNACLRTVDPLRHESATASARYAAGQDLRFSLRSLETYAAWVRKIYIVTDRQRPEWLIESERVQVVDHREILPELDSRGVYNSHAIETALHRIRGLSEHYLYMNDDVFFRRPVSPSAFFTPAGAVRVFLSNNLIMPGKPNARDLPIDAASKNTRDAIFELTGRRVTQKLLHTPHPISKRVVEELEQQLPAWFRETANSSFRHPADLSVSSSLAPYYAAATGRGVASKIDYAYAVVNESFARSVAFRRIQFGKDVSTFCLNMVDDRGLTSSSRRAAIDLLARLFPLPSQHERR